MALNGCHRVAAHHNWQWMQFLLQDHFCWPGMVDHMQRMLKNCERCIRHEDAQSKVALYLIIITAPIGTFAHRLYQHRDDNGAQQTTKGHEHSSFSGPLHETGFGLCYPQSDCQDCCQVPVPRVHLDLLSCSQASKWSGTQLYEQHFLEVVQAHAGLRRLGLYPTMLRPMGRWNAHTKPLCRWSENSAKIGRQTGPTTCWRWCKPTTLQDQLWLGIAHVTWCFGDDHRCQLTSTSQLWE